MSMQLLLRRQIRDKAGNITFDSGDLPSSSFVLSFLKHIWHLMNHEYAVNPPDEGTHPDTAGANRTLRGNVTTGNMFNYAAPLNISTYGTVVGTGTAAEANSDYALQTQIAHGVGAGQLSYGACGTVEAIVVGSNVDMTLTRSWLNGSGGVITVNEIGVYVSSQDSAAAQRFFCIVRDVLAAGDAIPNGSTYTVVYTLRTTV